MENRILKRTFYVTAVIVLASVLASGMIESWTRPAKMYSNAKTVTETSYNGDTYILTAVEDRIVAFKSGSDRPYIETTRSVSSLPYDVQEKLKRGIEFGSEEELKKAINEYCS